MKVCIRPLKLQIVGFDSEKGFLYNQIDTRPDRDVQIYFDENIYIKKNCDFVKELNYIINNELEYKPMCKKVFLIVENLIMNLLHNYYNMGFIKLENEIYMLSTEQRESNFDVISKEKLFDKIVEFSQ